MSKEIILNSKTRKELAGTFKVSLPTVWSALTYKTNSGTAKMLRAAALQRGELLLDGNNDSSSEKQPSCYITEVPHQIIFLYTSRVRLVCNLDGDGDVVTEVDGEERKRYIRPLISELATIKAKPKR